jgi:hypothetical protein
VQGVFFLDIWTTKKLVRKKTSWLVVFTLLCHMYFLLFGHRTSLSNISSDTKMRNNCSFIP